LGASFFIPFLNGLLSISDFSSSVISDDTELSKNILTILFDNSIVGQHAPIILYVLKILIGDYAGKTAPLLNLIISKIKAVLASLGTVSKLVPENERKIVHVDLSYEEVPLDKEGSDHNLFDHTNLVKLIKAPNMSKTVQLTLKFDQETKLNSTDKIVIYKDQDKETNNFTDKVFEVTSSTSQDDLRAEIIIPGNKFYITFVSSGALPEGEESRWGWELNISAKEETKTDRVVYHWLYDLQRHINVLLNKTVYVLTRGSR
jgi:hypothetical protein